MNGNASLSLVRLLIQTSRIVLIFCLLWLALFSIAAVIASPFLENKLSQLLLAFGGMPLVLLSLGLFLPSPVHLGSEPRKGTNWMFTLPISDHQLSRVPALMRFVWQLFSWSTLCLLYWMICGLQVPFFSGAAVLVGGSALFAMLLWIPTRHDLLRGAGFVAIVLLLQFLFVFTMSLEFDDRLTRQPAWQWMHLVITIAGIATAAISWFALPWFTQRYRSMHLWNSITAEDAAALEQRIAIESASPSLGMRIWRTLASLNPERWATRLLPRGGPGQPISTLIRHDLRLLLGNGVKRAVLIIGACVYLVVIVCSPPQVIAVLTVVFFSWYLGMGMTELLASNSCNSKKTMPPYLATAPISAKDIATARAIAIVVVTVLPMLLTGLVMAIKVQFPPASASMNGWINQVDTLYGDGAGQQFIVLGTVATLLLSVGVSTLGIATGLTGRSRLNLSYSIGFVTAFFGMCGIVAFWFIQQTDFDSAIDNAWKLAAIVPTIAIVAASLKLLFAVFSAWHAYHKRWIDPRSLAFRSIA
ncbi:MAG: hypothetical protein AAFP90_18855, partial [Planctomycetota bacterium]